MGIKKLKKLLKEKIKNKYYQIKNDKIIKEYNKYKENRKAKGVIYTCITGGYDSLKTHKYIDFDWDYICFTDNKNIKTDGIWEIKPLIFNELDNGRNNRWHKVNPHKIFLNYTKSIYIDGNIRILSKSFFENLENKKENIFISTLHPKRKCLYTEAEECIKNKLEKEEIIKKQIKKIEEEGFPKNYGLYEANIIYRHHNNEKIIALNEEWWYFIKNFAKRDQLSLTYICWKNNIPFTTFLNKSYREKNNEIEITDHLN